MIWNAVVLALREIRRNLLRSGLTMLGVVIGVAAVITLVTLGGGATERISADISGLGRNLVILVPGAQRVGGPPTPAPAFTLEDARAIAREVAGVAAVAPQSPKSMLAVYGNKNWRTIVAGTDNGYFTVREWPLAAGRAFSDGEERAGSPACILGTSVRANLFGRQDPLGASVRIGKVSCLVIGLLESKGQSTFGTDQDDLILMPIRTLQRRIAGNRDVGQIFISTSDASGTAKVLRDITALMRQRRHLQKQDEDNFQVRDLKEIADMVEKITGVLTAFLSAIAGISLLVGGIGIMNIMLVSVTERTREIGIRLAIGALEREVLMQFLVEAVLLSSIGGLIGIVLGLSGAALAAHFLRVPFHVNLAIIVVAFGFAAFVGVVFGYFPARRAARLDPIEAVRHE
jgi:putative ABC transport system permease protein